MKHIYVGNLSAGTTAAELQLLFEQYGKVNKTGIICEKETGRSRGFAFVLMSNDAEGDNAINSLNRQMVNGKAVDVQAMGPREDRKDWKSRR